MVHFAAHLAFAATVASLASASALPARKETFVRAPIRKPKNADAAKDVFLREKTRVSQLSTAATGSGAAINEDVSYIAAVKVGTQTFNLIVDTGSSNTWVGAGTKYVKSSTGTSTGKSVSVSYGSGSFSGTEYTDTVTYAGLTVAKQSVGVASQATGFTGVDGIFGVGPVDLTQGTVSGSTTVPTFLDNLYSQGTISTEVLGVYFAPESGSDTADSNGELTIGGTDSTKYSGSISYVTASGPYWDLTVSSVAYGTTTLVSSNSAIVDTGTTLIYIPTSGYNKFLSAAGGKTDSNSGLAVFTTKPTGNITITIGGVGYILTPTQYLVPTAQYSYYGLTSGKYYAWINDGGASGVDFIIGQKFLENYYSVFDTTNNRIGFATRT